MNGKKLVKLVTSSLPFSHLVVITYAIFVGESICVEGVGT